MTLTRRGIVVLYAATALLSTTAGATAQKWNPITRQLDHCRTFTITEGDAKAQARADALYAAGWRGNPADHAERLYSPACQVR
jgi:hypothetical protein